MTNKLDMSMKNLKYIISLVLLFGLFSCNQDAVMPTIDSSNIGAVDAAFSSSVAVYDLKQSDNGQIKVLMYRGNTKGAATVPISISGTGTTQLTLASNSVTFNDGEGSAYATLNYNFAAIPPATKYIVTLTITDATMISQSKVSAIRVEAQLPLNYVSFGTGTYESGFYEESWAQPVFKANVSTTLDYYKLPGCYYAGYDIVFRVDNGVLKVDQQNIGWFYSASYGYVYVSPQTTSISGKRHTWNSRFVLPLGGVAFTGSYDETFVMP